ncbi:YlbF family regulator [Clostridium tetani]|uniref:YlbF family regulator n=1 Tax=Clostridium tetani TaxID=1513 RepID=UPI00100B8E5F|nr:YlbF family regulator [Clostridium tetani]RXM58069.1 YlbF family regulator [Clostridium tetani]RXM79281.1 YlbF family regulator [Clostridium tetani]RYV00093.1 YlbF family regulator [Clostridium tetani]
MNLYDKAHELARVLKDCPEVVELRNTSVKMKENEDNLRMLKDFRQLQYEAYYEQLNNEKISEETETKLNKLGSIIAMNKTVSNYLEAESRFAVIWEDLIKILNEAVDVDLSFESKK